VEPASRYTTAIELDVSSRWVEHDGGGALVSHNHIREVLVGADGKPVRSKEYDRVYWVAEVSRAGSLAQLAFGSGSVPGQSPGATGSFDAESRQMASRQVVGGSLKVEIDTDLSTPGAASTLERVSIGPSLHSESRITFGRSKN
jgi:hypothetical protein